MSTLFLIYFSFFSTFFSFFLCAEGAHKREFQRSGRQEAQADGKVFCAQTRGKTLFGYGLYSHFFINGIKSHL